MTRWAGFVKVVSHGNCDVLLNSAGPGGGRSSVLAPCLLTRPAHGQTGHAWLVQPPAVPGLGSVLDEDGAVWQKHVSSLWPRFCPVSLLASVGAYDYCRRQSVPT